MHFSRFLIKIVGAIGDKGTGLFSGEWRGQSDSTCSSLNRYLVEFLKLVESTVPVVEHLEELDHFHRCALKVVLRKLP